MSEQTGFRKFYLETLHAIFRPGVGNGRRKTFVFLHGSGFDASVFMPVMAHKKLLAHDVYALDLPGHGRSAALPPHQAYSYASMAERVAESLNAGGIENCVLVGWSLGGHIAFELLERTDLVSGAICCGAPAMPNNPLSTLFAFHFTKGMLLASKREFNTADANAFQSLALGKHASDEHAQALMQSDGRARLDIASNMLRLQNRDQKRLALEAGHRLCFIHADDDPLIRADYIEHFTTNSQFTGTYTPLAAGGHAPFLANPDQFLEASLTFEESLANAPANQAMAA
ncbi:MAG: alpha/beta hydrolase [Pseudomonadota bacterium]